MLRKPTFGELQVFDVRHTEKRDNKHVKTNTQKEQRYDITFLDFLPILLRSRCCSSISPTVGGTTSVEDRLDFAGCCSLAAAAVGSVLSDASSADAGSVCAFAVARSSKELFQ